MTIGLGIQIGVDPTQAVGGSRAAEDALGKTEAAGRKAQIATENLAGTFKRLADHQRAMAAEAARARAPVDGLASSFAKIGQLQIGQTLHATGKAFAGLTEQIKREQDALDAIHGPMKQYQQDLVTLDLLLKKGEISQAQHTAALARSRSSAGMANPMDAVSLGSVPSARNHMAGAGSAMMGVGIAAFAGKEILDLSDSYTNLENRLRGVAGSQANLNTLMDATKGVADRTRSDWGSTAESYVRLINATKQLGISQDRGLKITETLNMALQSSGASSSEAAAGTLQLMQGLSSGALAGDEFRSIAEQLPDLLDLFAKQMGVSRGELKKLGAEGKITADIVIKALESSATAIETKFNASTATASQQWTVLKNQLTETAGEVVQSTGVMSVLGDVVGGVGTAIKVFGGAVGVASDVLDALGPVGDGVKFMLESLFSPITATKKAIGALTEDVTSLALSYANAKSPMEAFAHGVFLGSDPVLKMTADLKALHDQLWRTHDPLMKMVDEFARLHGELTDRGRLSFGPGGFVDGLTSGLGRLNGAFNSDWGPTMFEKGLERIGFKAKTAKKAVDDFRDSLLRQQADEDTATAQGWADEQAEIEEWKEQDWGGSRSMIDVNKAPDGALNMADWLKKTRKEQADAEFNRAADPISNFDKAVRDLNDGAMQDLKTSAQSVGDALVDAFTGADFSAEKFLDSLSQMLLKMAVTRGINFAFGAAGLGGGATGFDSMVGGGRTPFLPGFATGGDAMIGGAGGTDSRLVMFRATPGESLHVRTPEQRQAAANSNRTRTIYYDMPGGGTAKFVTHDDFEELHLRSVERNAPAIRSRITGR